MYGNVVGGVLTVGVGQHSIEVCVERERAAAVGTQEQTTLVIVVGMEIVPEDWRSTEYRGQLFDGRECYRLGDDLWTCTGVGVEQFRVFHSPQTIHVTVCMYSTHHSMYVCTVLMQGWLQERFLLLSGRQSKFCTILHIHVHINHTIMQYLVCE